MLKMVGFDALVKAKGPYYNSASKGKMLVSGMATPHIQNALIGSLTKEFNDYVRQTIKTSGSQNLDSAIEDLDLSYFRNKNKDIDNLITELLNRYMKGTLGL